MLLVPDWEKGTFPPISPPNFMHPIMLPQELHTNKYLAEIIQDISNRKNREIHKKR